MVNIMVLFLTLIFAQSLYAASYQTLDIVQPRAGLTTANRFYLAYPGLEYNVRVAVEGGAYPYTYSLTAYPSGMTINTATGVISWANPTTTGSPHNVTVQVTDDDSNTDSVSYTLTVTSSGFLFISPNGSGTETGDSYANPMAFVDMYNGSETNGTADSRDDDTYAGYFVYYLGGTYTPYSDGIYHEDSARTVFRYNDKPLVWIAYPGETPTVSTEDSYLVFYNTQDNLYVDGITFDVGSNAYSTALRIAGGSSHVTIKDCIFENQSIATQPTNRSVIFIENNGSGNYWGIHGNTFQNNLYMAIEGYNADHVVIFDNTFTNHDSHAIYPKMSTRYWSIFDNVISSCEDNAINLDAYDVSGSIGNFEVHHNLINNHVSGQALYVNFNYSSGGIEESWIYRNTFDGDIVFREISDTNDGPFNLFNNVIINSSGDWSCSSCTLPSRVIDTDNVKGTVADSIIDVDGNLVGSYRTTYLGVSGYETGDDGTIINATYH